MISMKEICKHSFDGLDPDVECNLIRLHFVLNSIRAHYGKPLTITSGYRTLEEHLKIYEERKKPAPMGSLHLVGAAADIDDPQCQLKSWILDHVSLMGNLEVYLEAFDDTPTWVHVQIYPPKSEKRFFEP